MLHVVAAGAISIAGDVASPVSAMGTALSVTAEWLTASVLCALVYWTLALFIARHRDGSGPERTTLLLALLPAAVGGSALYLWAYTFTLRYPLLSAAVPILFLLFFYLRSDGRFTSNRVRWLAIFFVFTVLGTFMAQKAPSQQDAQFLAHVPRPLLGVFGLLGNVFTVMSIIAGILPQIYARARLRREQGAAWPRGTHLWGRWLVGLAGASLVVLFGAALLSPLPASSPAGVYLAARTGYFLLASLLPVAGALALARGRPYDCDALANRVLIYTPLTAGLLAIYGASIASLALFFPGFGTLPATLYLPFLIAIVLLMYAAYRPLLDQLRERIDRRCFRRRYEAARVLATFSAALPTTSGLEQLSNGLVTALAKAFRPAAATLWAQVDVALPARRPASLLAQATDGVPPATLPAVAQAIVPSCLAAAADAPGRRWR